MSMLERVVSFSIERDSHLEELCRHEGRNFEGFLRQVVGEAYETLKEPFVKGGLYDHPRGSGVAEISYKYRDEHGSIKYSMRINVSDGCMLSGNPEGNWPGIIYFGVDDEHSDYKNYEEQRDDKFISSTNTLLKKRASRELAGIIGPHLMEKEVPYTVRQFTDQDEMYHELSDIYLPLITGQKGGMKKK